MGFDFALEDMLDFSDASDSVLPPSNASDAVAREYGKESKPVRTTAADNGYANQQVSVTGISALMQGVPIYKDPKILLAQQQFLSSKQLGLGIAGTPNQKLGSGFDEIIPSDLKAQAKTVGAKDVAQVKINTDRTIVDRGNKDSGGGASAVPAGGAAGNGSGIKDPNARSIYAFLSAKGLTDEQCAGILGNIYAESKYNPRIVEIAYSSPPHLSDDVPGDKNKLGQPGFGICQWTSPNRKQGLRDLANTRGTKASDINTQCEFLWQELNASYKKSVLDKIFALKDLKPADQLAQSSDIFLVGFEGPQNASNTTKKKERQGYGSNILGEIKAGGGAASGPAATSSGPQSGILGTTALRNAWAPACTGPWASFSLFGSGVVSVRPSIIEAVKALNTCLQKYNYSTRKGDTGAFNCRKITGGSGYSLHAYGIALDINWNSNPYQSTLKTDMSSAMVNSIKSIYTTNGHRVWGWGGDYRGNKDAMHYEIVCTPGDLLTGINMATVGK